MTALIAGLVGTLFGAVIGFYFRAAEFRRDQRLKVYGDFIAAFLNVGHEGAGGATFHFSPGDAMTSNEHREEFVQVRSAIAEAIAEFERATARLRLVASSDARSAAAELEAFIDRNVREMPPLRPFLPEDPEQWGEAFKVGPAKIDSETVRLAHEFADRVSADVTPRRDSEGGWLRRWRKRRSSDAG